MTRDTAQLFFALLTMAALAATVGLITARLAAGRSPRAAGVVRALAPFTNGIAAVIAATSMLGSLYFSEIADYLPCTLCWYQRIAMYSLAIILSIAAFRSDRAIRVYALPLAGIGASIALYHWLLERLPDLDAGACSAQVPCEFVWFERFGFVTLSFMALTGFVAIITLVTMPGPPAAIPDPSNPTNRQD